MDKVGKAGGGLACWNNSRTPRAQRLSLAVWYPALGCLGKGGIVALV